MSSFFRGGAHNFVDGTKPDKFESSNTVRISPFEIGKPEYNIIHAPKTFNFTLAEKRGFSEPSFISRSSVRQIRRTDLRFVRNPRLTGAGLLRGKIKINCYDVPIGSYCRVLR